MSTQLDPNSVVAAKIAAVTSRAGSAQARVLGFIQEHPTDALLSSANDIGAAVDASDASVIRTVQKLGYAGLRDFKEDLRASLDGLSGHTRASPTRRRTVQANGRRNTGRDIYSELRQMIMEGGLNSDRHVTEPELAELLGVSRTPVREALQMLERNGLVVRSHQGITVPAQSRAQVNELYDAHILLNGAAVRKASERRSAADVQLLRELNAVMRNMSVEQAGSVDAVIANQRFHGATLEVARDRTLSALARQLNDQLDLWGGTTLDVPGRWGESLDEHDMLIDAIEARDSDGAAAVVTQHLETARRIRQRMLSEKVTRGSVDDDGGISPS